LPVVVSQNEAEAVGVVAGPDSDSGVGEFIAESAAHALGDIGRKSGLMLRVTRARRIGFGGLDAVARGIAVEERSLQPVIPETARQGERNSCRGRLGIHRVERCRGLSAKRLAVLVGNV